MYGTPRRILTDQGRNFESVQFAKLCNLFRISKIKTSLSSIHSPTESVNVSTKLLNNHLLKFYQKISRHLGTSTWASQSSLTMSQFTQVPALRPSFSPSAQKRAYHPISFSAFPRLQQSRMSESQVKLRVYRSFLLKSFSIRSHAFTLDRENLHFFQ